MTFRTCYSPAPTRVKPQPAPAILSQESVHTTLSITHHTRKRPSTGPRTTHGPHSHKYQLGKALSTHPMIGDSDGTKVQGAFPYYLIVVHEAADDECAHARLITDINHLRYRYTSLLMSSETTRALSKTESWVAAWLEFFLRSTLGLSSMSEMKTENSWLGNE
jgi:hypothetical protein